LVGKRDSIVYTESVAKEGIFMNLKKRRDI